VNNKKAPNLYRMRLLSYFVTQKVEKSNFYKDLEKLLNWVDSDKKIQKQNKNEEKQKRE
jgi:ribosomal protein S18